MSMSIKASPDGTFGEILVNGAVVATLPVTGNAVIPGLVGTVSQSGGVPTGAVVERGSNANGEYVRFADGTQICRVRMNSLSGNFVAWSFPAGFIDNTYVATGTSAQSTNYLITLDHANSNSLALRAYNSSGSMIAASCAIIAIGRWF